jgi:release factor glutamine methyltransferase
MLTLAEALGGIGAGNPRLEAELLVAEALGRPRSFLLAHPEAPVEGEAARRLDRMVERRLAGEPLAYVLGTADFMGFLLEVGPGVLIPRSETERLVELVEEELGGAGRILDVGTGTGAILVALAGRSPGIRGVGTDVSERALAYARRNVERHGLGDRLRLIATDLFAGLRPSEIFDGVVSNPPYIASEDLPRLPREIREYEPREALDGGHGGMEFLRRIVSEAWRYLRRAGLLALELSPEQARPLRAWAEAQGRYEEIRIRQDLAGRDRFLLARRR